MNIMHIVKNIPAFRKAGYTLIELSVSTSILAILAVGGLAMIQKKNEADNIRQTKYKLRTVKAALDKFARVNGYLPCPASPSLPEKSVYFGKDAKPSPIGAGDMPVYDKDTGECVSGDISFNAGMIPVRTLNLSDDFAYDGWERKFVYKLAPYAADPKKFLLPSFRGDIRVVDLRGNNKTDIDNIAPNNQGALYVLISYGSNGRDVAWGRAIEDAAALEAPDDSQVSGLENQNLHHERGIYIQDDASEGFDDMVAFGSKSKVSAPKEIFLPTALHGDACSNADFLAARPELLNGLAGDQATKDVIADAAVTLSALCKYSPKTQNISQTIAGTEGVAFRFDADRPAVDGSQPGSTASVDWQDVTGKVAHPAGGAVYRNASINGLPAFKSGGGHFEFDSIMAGMDDLDDKQYFGRTPEDKQQFTFFMAIRTGTDVTTPQSLYSSGGNFSVFIENAQLRANVGGTLITAAHTVLPSTNYIVSFARGRAGHVFILDEEATVNAMTLPDASIGQTQFIGGTGGGNYFRGSIGEAILYNNRLPPKRYYEVVMALVAKWGANFSFTDNSPVSCPYKGQEYIKTAADPELKCQCPDGMVLNSQMGVSNACIEDSASVGECVPVSGYDAVQVEQAAATQNKNAMLPSAFSDLILWLDGADCSTISLDSGRKVSAWRDKSVNRNDFFMADPAYMPIYETDNTNVTGTLENQPLGALRFSRLGRSYMQNTGCTGANCTDLYLGRMPLNTILGETYRQASIYIVAQISTLNDTIPSTLFNSGTHDWGVKLRYDGIPYVFMRPSNISGVTQNAFVADMVQSAPNYLGYGNRYHVFHGYIQAPQSLNEAPKLEMYVDDSGELYDQVWVMQQDNGAAISKHQNTINGKFYTDNNLVPFLVAYNAAKPNTIGSVTFGGNQIDLFEGRIGEIVVIKDYIADKADKKDGIMRYLKCKWRDICN